MNGDNPKAPPPALNFTPQISCKKKTQPNSTNRTIANLATATYSDHSTVATLTATNSTLTSALTACKLQLVKSLNTVAKLTTSLSNLNKNHSARPPTTGIRNYWCTHGYLSNHSIRDCEHPREGHDKVATKADTKGGSARNKPSWEWLGTKYKEKVTNTTAPLTLVLNTLDIFDYSCTSHFLGPSTPCTNQNFHGG